MRYSLNTVAAVAAAAAIPLAAAQTYSDCNPMNSSQFPCTPDPGLSSSTFSSDFTQGSSANTSWSYVAETVEYGSTGAEFTIAERGDAPTIETDFYIFYGKVEVTMKSAPGTGIISSIVLQSDDLDEIDWEFLGGDNAHVQTNYFGKGNTTTYDRMIEYEVDTPQDTSHTYTIDWTAESIKWEVDGTTVRTLNYADAVDGTNFPQTPMNVRLGIWAGGDSDNGYWTIVWAGGNTTYSSAAGMPWTMLVEKVEITNYGPASAYNWTDTTGDSDSIVLLDGANYTATSAASSAHATKTSAGAGLGAGAHSSSAAAVVSTGTGSAAAASSAGSAGSGSGSAAVSYTGTPAGVLTLASTDAAATATAIATDSGSGTGSGSCPVYTVTATVTLSAGQTAPTSSVAAVSSVAAASSVPVVLTPGVSTPGAGGAYTGTPVGTPYTPTTPTPSVSHYTGAAAAVATAGVKRALGLVAVAVGAVVVV